MAINLKSIAKGQRIKAPKIVVYGVGGIGKTTFASNAPSPIFIFTEEGQGALDVARFELQENNPVATKWQDIIDCLIFLHREKHDYKTVVLDSIDFAEPLLHAHVCKQHGHKKIEDFGYGKGYIYACEEGRTLTAGLDALRNDRGMSVIIIGHCEVKKVTPPDSESYDRYKVNVHERLANLIYDWSDASLFCQYKVTVVKDKDEKVKDATRARGVGMGDRVMYTQERPAWRAKNRYSLPGELPLEWPAFQKAVLAGAETKKQTKGA